MIGNTELVTDIAAREHVSTADATRWLTAVVESITAFLSSGKAVTIANFGTFNVAVATRSVEEGVVIGEEAIQSLAVSFKPVSSFGERPSRGVSES